jgi:hypothetical protein
LYIPPLVDGDFTDVMLGNEIVFADKDERGILRECV